MSFIAGYLLGLESGDSYRNEPKIITENGVYTPPDGVRWNRLTVDVPQGGEDMTLNKILQLPYKASGNICSYGGYNYSYVIFVEQNTPVRKNTLWTVGYSSLPEPEVGYTGRKCNGYLVLIESGSILWATGFFMNVAERTIWLSGEGTISRQQSNPLIRITNNYVSYLGDDGAILKIDWTYEYDETLYRWDGSIIDTTHGSENHRITNGIWAAPMMSNNFESLQNIYTNLSIDEICAAAARFGYACHNSRNT